MVQKALSPFKIFALAILPILIVSCNTQNGEKDITSSSSYMDTTHIPNDTVLSSDKDLKLDNGIYYINNNPYAGHIKELDENGNVKMVSGYWQGMQHGESHSYYPDGKTKDIRLYRANKSFGKQIGFWENGKQKFEFTYIDDKREGLQKQWYSSGEPYAFLTFLDDKENGLQQAWRENGKPYINYEAKDGFRYGLQKSALCYTLADQKLITKE